MSSARTTTHRHPARRGWLAAALVTSLILVSACSPSGKHASSPTTSLAAQTCTKPVAFDPPSRFDMAHAVPLTDEQALHGTLHDTTFYSITNSTLHATDLTCQKRSWSTDLSTSTKQDYLTRPFIVGDTVITLTGNKAEPEPKPTAADDTTPNYTINITGISTRTKKVSWRTHTDVYSSVFNSASAFYKYSPPEQCFNLNVIEHDDEILVTIDVVDGARSTLSVDSGTGDVRWTGEGRVIITASGRYAIASTDNNESPAIVVDLQTGRTIASLPAPSSGTSIYNVAPLVDPDGDTSRLVLQLRGQDKSHWYLRFSSADGTTEPFTPAADDMRYQLNCYAAAAPVLLCQDDKYFYGIDSTSGHALWKSNLGLDRVTQYDGYAYGAVKKDDYMYSIVDLSTGKIVKEETDFMPIGYMSSGDNGDPIQVNEFGAVGTLCDRSVAPAASRCAVWAPASG